MLNKHGIKIIGTSFESLDLAEDRGRFSNLLRELGIPYPKFGVIENADQSVSLSRELGFPLLVRPSYVLGGQSMKIVINEEELENTLTTMFDPFFTEILRFWGTGLHPNLLDKIEKFLVRKALTETKGNQVQAAKLLGISRNTLRNRIDKYNLSS
jgi:DNA-binding protein Fis